jgi:protein gp37
VTPSPAAVTYCLRPSTSTDRLAAPFDWATPKTVFVNSLSDLFHADVPLDFIRRAFAVMAATPWHTYQVLTKRAGEGYESGGRRLDPASCREVVIRTADSRQRV